MSSHSVPVGRSRKLVQSVEVENARALNLKQTRSGHLANFTKLINRISLSLVPRNKEKVKALFKQLEKTFEKISDVTAKYREIVSLEENQKALSLLNEQSMKIEQTKELIDEYLLKDTETEKSTSTKASFLTKSRSSSKMHPPSQSSFNSLLQKRAESAQAELLAEQAEAKFRRQMELIEQKKKLEEQELLEKVKEAQDKADLAKLQATLEEEKINSENGSDVTIPKHSGFRQRASSSYYVPTRQNIKHLDTEENSQIAQKTPRDFETFKFIENLPNVPCVKKDSLNVPKLVKNRHLEESSSAEIANVKNLTSNDQQKISVNEPIDKFIDNLTEGVETKLKDITVLTTSEILRWEYESRNLPAIELQRFDGTPAKWPEFIENFKIRVHNKLTFDDNTRMERLLSVLDGEAKRSIQTIGCNGIFYASALKTLKRDYGNPVVVSQLKLNAILDLPQLQSNDRTALRRYYQQLSSTIMWLKSMGYNSSISSTENLTKAVARLPNYLRNQFYKTSKDKIFTEGGMDLHDFQKWLDSKLKEQFNPIASLIAEQDLKAKKATKTPKIESERKIRTFATKAVTYEKQTKGQLKCWICEGDHKVSNCKNFIDKKVEERRKIVADKGLCFNCLSNNHKIKNCKSDKGCREIGCGKRHNTLVHLPAQQSDLKTAEIEINNISSDIYTYLQVLPVTLFNKNFSVSTNAILDTGSDSTLIRKDIASKLHLEGDEKKLKVSNVLTDSAIIKSNYRLANLVHNVNNLCSIMR